MNKLAQALALVALAIASLTPIHAHASTVDMSKSCPVGYVLVKGKCKPIEITGNEYLSRLAHCSTNHGKTIKSFKVCMATHKGNNQVK